MTSLPDDALGLPRGRVRLVPPNPAWAVVAAEEACRIGQAVGEARLPPLAVEHVGSTSVPGLLAKPLLDLLGGHPVGTDPLAYAGVLAGLGYAARGERVQPGVHVFVRGPETRRTHLLHLAPEGSVFWRERLRFRDRLRADPALAAAYAGLKQRLAAVYARDREAYTAAKGAFVARALSRVDDPAG